MGKKSCLLKEENPIHIIQITSSLFKLQCYYIFSKVTLLRFMKNIAVRNTHAGEGGGGRIKKKDVKTRLNQPTSKLSDTFILHSSYLRQSEREPETLHTVQLAWSVSYIAIGSTPCDSIG
jgi:hypothetical protein